MAGVDVRLHNASNRQVARPDPHQDDGNLIDRRTMIVAAMGLDGSAEARRAHRRHAVWRCSRGRKGGFLVSLGRALLHVRDEGGDAIHDRVWRRMARQVIHEKIASGTASSSSNWRA